jgi:transcriptional regulator with XRE-family HTH domain
MSKPSYIYGHKGKENGSTLFGDRLKKLRMSRGIGVTDFAKQLGCHVCQITAYENRGVMPHCFLLMAMATLLKCSTDYLLGMERFSDDPPRTT